MRRGRVRGRAGRGEHPEAPAGAGRAAVHRRDHAERNTTSTSRRMRRWSGASSRCRWASPAQAESEAILLGLRDRYEAHHRVHITDEAIHAAVTLSARYISDRFLPDKAIDLIDEAASRVRIKAFTAPPDMKEQRGAAGGAEQGDRGSRGCTRTSSWRRKPARREEGASERHGRKAPPDGSRRATGKVGNRRPGRGRGPIVSLWTGVPGGTDDRGRGPAADAIWRRRCTGA